MKKYTVLIIGGNGFLGKNLCNFFLKKKWRVINLSLKKISKNKKIGNVEYFNADISKYSQIQFLKKIQIDFVINSGGYIDHINKKKIFNGHVKGCHNLYKIFLKKKIMAFVQLGTSLEYGNVRSPHTEKIKEKPRGIYGKCKLQATKLLKNSIYNFPFVILRLYQVYGPGQKNDRLIPYVINSCLENKKFPCTNGNQFRDFLYIDDFLRAVYLILKNKKCRREIFNIGYGKPQKIKTIIKYINKKIKLGKPQFGKIFMKPHEKFRIFPSIKKANKYLNWYPRINFDKGLDNTIKYYKLLYFKNLRNKIKLHINAN